MELVYGPARGLHVERAKAWLIANVGQVAPDPEGVDVLCGIRTHDAVAMLLYVAVAWVQDGIGNVVVSWKSESLP